ncbi:hypothetical protein QBC38DRAFT_548924 [Podospora fimiseda]|uniref:Uncharacterized protein n=1 Tax=Podospora fimiseda TaxID=252190 RepID=A0AAN6YP57_9PEZI|nr:hypothetical protein QBC38DRAFT_548924 [Podospora fimiseda]
MKKSRLHGKTALQQQEMRFRRHGIIAFALVGPRQFNISKLLNESDLHLCCATSMSTNLQRAGSARVGGLCVPSPQESAAPWAGMIMRLCATLCSINPPLIVSLTLATFEMEDGSPATHGPVDPLLGDQVLPTQSNADDAGDADARSPTTAEAKPASLVDIFVGNALTEEYLKDSLSSFLHNDSPNNIPLGDLADGPEQSLYVLNKTDKGLDLYGGCIAGGIFINNLWFPEPQIACCVYSQPHVNLIPEVVSRFKIEDTAVFESVGQGRICIFSPFKSLEKGCSRGTFTSKTICCIFKSFGMLRDPTLPRRGYLGNYTAPCLTPSSPLTIIQDTYPRCQCAESKQLELHNKLLAPLMAHNESNAEITKQQKDFIASLKKVMGHSGTKATADDGVVVKFHEFTQGIGTAVFSILLVAATILACLLVSFLYFSVTQPVCKVAKQLHYTRIR